MAEWVEIPRHRVYVITNVEAFGYEFLSENGETRRAGEPWRLARRKSDGRLFRAARLHGGLVRVEAPYQPMMVLEEV